MKVDEFKEVIKEGEVLVDFWASWCGPCKAVSPILDSISEEMGLKLVKVDVDESNELANEYNLTSIPTMMLFRDGELVQTIVGAHSKEVLSNKLKLF